MDIADIISNRLSDGGTSVADVVVLQTLAIIDHLCIADDTRISQILGPNEELGGSKRISSEEMSQMLSQIPDFYTSAGGSSANTGRSLASGFHLKVALVGPLHL